MNHVFLSGTVNTVPKLVHSENETPHAIMDLTVTHRTVAGIEKSEQYPISAWRGIALRMTEMITPGSRVSIKGYLSQKVLGDSIFIEVTAEEFQVSNRGPSIRPARRIMPKKDTDSKQDNLLQEEEKEKEQSDEPAIS